VPQQPRLKRGYGIYANGTSLVQLDGCRVAGGAQVSAACHAKCVRTLTDV